MFPLSIHGPLSRAVFVAAIMLAAFALFRYRRSLSQTARRAALLPIALRGASLLLLACALAGVRLEYEATTGPRVALSYADAAANPESTDAAAFASEKAAGERIISVLQKRSVEVVEADEAGNADNADNALTATGSEPFVAGLLLTDGALRAEEAAAKVNGLSARTGGAPVFVVMQPEESSGPRVSLESATATSRPARGVPVVVRCLVHGRGMRGRESLVTIADEAKVQASARVAWANDDEWRTVTLEVVPKLAGLVEYVARIEAAGGEDARTLSRSLSLYVEERRWRVLFFEGEPTWEAKFIRRALERSLLFEVDYLAQVSRAAAVGSSERAVEQDMDEAGEKDATNNANGGATTNSGTTTNSIEAKLHSLLASAERLNDYDCIIIGATPNALLSATEGARLSEWTERRGGGLVILGGNSFAGSVAAPGGKLYRLLPAAIDPRNFASDAGQLARSAPLEAERARDNISLLPTEAGAGGPLSGYLSAFQQTTARADLLSGQGFRLGALRAGASVLAVAGRAAGGAVQPSETGAPLIAAARYGAGRVLLFAPADSWRLRTGMSGEQDETSAPYSALWQGLLLWAAAGARPPVEIILSDDSPAAREPLTAELRVRDQLFAALKIERLRARLQPLTKDADEAADDGAPAAEVTFVPVDDEPGVWRASLYALAPGRYALEADYAAGGKSGSTIRNFAVVAPHSLEPGAARDTLNRMARETGGELLDSAGADALVERINATRLHPESTRRTWELRSWWPLALVIPLLLSAAWLIEKRLRISNDEQ